MPRGDAVYLLPIRRSAVDEGELAELSSYLLRLAPELPVVVADGSPPDVRARHAASWAGSARLVAVPPAPPGTNGKVVGVLAGLAATAQPRVVVADDDVRWDGPSLDRALRLLDEVDLVVPQNVFDPAPWHARWDTARSLVNRALGHDYSGTVVLRRDAVGPEGYDAGVLFENLELERTVVARGGRVVHALDLVVPRRPPDARRFAEQRVRQAYDSLAQPARLAVELAVAPVLVGGVLVGVGSRGRTRSAGWGAVLMLVTAAVVLAEAGRRRAGGTAVFSATAALWAPAWVVERALCAWLALGWWALGGVPYSGTRLRRAAHPVRALRPAAPERGAS
ncbi:glycosyltransferase [Cellulosimicrobium sp. PMB13]|uniref:glycosyltransferase n=1 Tax=Cellulosimicrobium sp. PMB13 TaxID=3120158 RepID=UPI003F4C0EFA